ncbi:hypothetical protein J5N97_018556 [Dioscorea zingiberensis]|uniref:Derlin n=1 Tax=Dioscorea zingiberensis TaxID=325984 RepID=A0A9D5CCB7_9LILI|nr:hypothetical protein J5N97_018556 [Dioscorea zingiberensis]
MFNSCRSIPTVMKACGVFFLVIIEAYFFHLFDSVFDIKQFQVWKLAANFFFLPSPFSGYFGFRLSMLARHGMWLPLMKLSAVDFLCMVIFGASWFLTSNFFSVFRHWFKILQITSTSDQGLWSSLPHDYNSLLLELIFLYCHLNVLCSCSKTISGDQHDPNVSVVVLGSFNGVHDPVCLVKRGAQFTNHILWVSDNSGCLSPWVLLGLDLIFNNPLKPDIMGILAGHLYYFLAVLYPLSGRKNILKTPLWVYP